MDHYKAIKLIALNNVVQDNDLEYRLRHIFRWYSKNFHTPLHLVDELPLDDILIHYYETLYEDMYQKYLDPEAKDNSFQREKFSLLETEEEKDQRLKEIAKDDVEFFETKKQVLNMKKLFEKFQKPVNIDKPKELPEAVYGSGSANAPIVSMKFKEKSPLDDIKKDDLEAILSKSGFGDEEETS